MSAEIAKNPHTTDSDRHSLIAALDTHLSIGTHDGQINGANVSEWIKALKEMQERNTLFKEWIDAIASLQHVCQQWLGEHSAWAKEIDVKFLSEPRSLSLYVVVDNDKVEIETRRAVSFFGLAIGGVFRIRCEARLTYDRVDGSALVIQSCPTLSSTPSE